jgi:hypothetical protein
MEHTEDRGEHSSWCCTPNNLTLVLAEHQSNHFALLRSKIRRLPPVHRATLRALIEHLARVASHADKNKMDAKNLAIVFGAVIFGEDEIPKGGDLLSVQSWKVGPFLFSDFMS